MSGSAEDPRGVVDVGTEITEGVSVASGQTKETKARQQIAPFLQEVYDLCRRGDTDAAGDRVFDFVDRLLCDGLYGVCDDVLRAVDVEKLDTKLMRSFLAITAAAKTRLPSRPMLYKTVEGKMLSIRGPEKARRILTLTNQSKSDL